ncbi:MAG: NAD-dependent epimerase/dehydratase family protein [Ignavibacteriota bacterium]
MAAYGDGLNHKESDPLAPDYHSIAYVRHKATTERLLFRMQAQSGLPLVTFRPPFVYGPGNPLLPRAVLLGSPAGGRPIIIPGDGHRLMQFVYLTDLVQAMVRSIDEPRAVGESFNIGDPKPITQVEFAEKLARVANVEVTLARVPRDIIQQAGGNANG